MTKAQAKYLVNSRELIDIRSIKKEFPQLDISEYPVDQVQIGNDIDIRTYECKCDDGIIRIKGAFKPKKWHELAIGYVTAE